MSLLPCACEAKLICPTGCFPTVVSSPLSKNFSLYRQVETSLEPAPSAPPEGRIAIVTDAGSDAVDVGSITRIRVDE